MLSETGDTAGAHAAHAKALAIRQKLADANPSVPQFQADVALSLLNMGWLRARCGKPGEAIEYFSREEAIRKTLADANPTVPVHRESLANCLTRAAEVLLQLGRPAEAWERCERAVALRETLVSAHPNVPEYRLTLAESLLRRGQARQAERDLAGASTNWRRAVALYNSAPALDGAYVFCHAGCHAALSSLSGLPGTGVSAGERDALADRAMALLKKAVGMGCRSFISYREEPAFDPLRGRPDFRLLLMDLAMPADPFARGR